MVKKKPTPAQRIRKLQTENRALRAVQGPKEFEKHKGTATHYDVVIAELRQKLTTAEETLASLQFVEDTKKRVEAYRADDFSKLTMEITLPEIGVPYHFIFTADWHKFSRLFAEIEFHKFCEWLKRRIDKTEGRIRLFEWGDPIDIHSWTTRHHMKCKQRTGDIDRQLEAQARAIADEAMKDILFTKDLWAVWLDGNHYSEDEFLTTTQMMCKELGGEYGGSATRIRVNVHLGNKTAPLFIGGEHCVGGGGGQAHTRGTANNQLYKYRVNRSVHIAVGAHIHALVADHVPIEEHDGVITGWNIFCGGFQYRDKDKEPYYVRATKGLLSLGAVELELWAEEENGELLLKTYARPILCDQNGVRFKNA